MGTWSISPKVEGVFIDDNGKATFAANLPYEQYTITYTNDNCKVEYVYNIPSGCENRCCKILSNPIGDTNCEGTVVFKKTDIPCENKKA